MMDRTFLEGLGLTPEQIEAVMVEDAKKAAYRRLLADLGVNPKYAERVMAVTDIGALELTEDGRTFKNVGSVADAIKTDWGAFIFDKAPQVETVERPSQKLETWAAELARQYHERHY